MNRPNKRLNRKKTTIKCSSRLLVAFVFRAAHAVVFIFVEVRVGARSSLNALELADAVSLVFAYLRSPILKPHLNARLGYADACGQVLAAVNVRIACRAEQVLQLGQLELGEMRSLASFASLASFNNKNKNKKQFLLNYSSNSQTFLRGFMF